MQTIVLIFVFLSSSILFFFLLPAYLKYRKESRKDEVTVSDYESIRQKSFLGKMKPLLGYLVKFNRKYKFTSKWISSHSPEYHNKLVRSGSPGNVTAEEFMVLKELLPVLFVFTMVFMLQLKPSVFYLIAVFLGIYLPDLWLNDKMKFRKTEVDRSLPDTLDTLALIVGAGLNFTEALELYIAKTKSSPLKDELIIVQDEVRLGRPFLDSLKLMSARIDSSSVNHFVTMLVQSQKTGVPLAEVLDTQAEDLRARRFHLAEEAGNKAPLKMIFPLLLFIMPNVFIVLFAPMVLKLFYAQ